MTAVVVAREADETTHFAASELARYLARMLQIDVPVVSAPPTGRGSWIELLVAPSRESSASFHAQDAITIDVRAGHGVIAGSSGRSVLFGVYRFLVANGCRWVRPGAAGEHVPVITAITDLRVAERPAYRHRILCIEGAFSLAHLQDAIDWAAKTGFNGFFMQFRDAYTFFERWYGDPERARGRTRLPRGTAASLARRAEREIRRRGLVLHAVGHGWACESLGIPGLGWDYPPPPVPPGTSRMLALVNGTRQLFGDVPINTNLCYSNREAHQNFVQEVVRYARDHPEVDVLHVWLADAANNHCECRDCVDIRPSDAYVDILNDIDHAMTELDLRQRLVCIAYQDLLWPPVVERIQDPSRFVFAFAPVSRSYGLPFKATSPTPTAMRPYRRNEIELPRTADDHAGYLAAWRQALPTDAFAFDYHLWRNQYTDLGSLRTARVLFEDLRALRSMGLHGFASCQPMRSAFPTPLAMSILAETLWDDAVEFDQVVSSSLEAAFGPSWRVAHDYLRSVSAHFDPAYLRGEPVDLDSVGRAVSELPGVMRAFASKFENILSGPLSPLERRSWDVLGLHSWLAEELAAIVALRTSGDVDAGVARWQRLEADLDHRLAPYDDLVDGWMLKTSLASALASRTEPPESWI
jgi:hypothetical protein